jgi:multiple sugar transport system substrate-binding protein
MINKKLTLALLFVLSFTLTACTLLADLPYVGQFFQSEEPGAVPVTGPVTLRMWGLWENPEVMDVVIGNFQDVNSRITVEYEDRSVLRTFDYKERIFARAGSDVGADVILVHNSWVPQLRQYLAPMPSNLMNAQTYSERFYPAATQSAVFDGNIYAVPFYYDGLVLVYNKSHFNQIGQQEPPRVWEEFRRIALRLTVRSERGGTLERAGAAIGNADNIDHFSDILGMMFAQTNVTIPNDLGSRAAQDAVNFYVSFVKSDRVWNNDMPEATTAFIQGRVSMIFIPSWRLLDILDADPSFDVGVAPVPQALPDRPATWSSFWMLAVPQTSQNTGAAWGLANYIASEEQELLRFSEASKFRRYGAPYANVSLAPQLANHPYLKPLLDTAPYGASSELAARSGNDLHTEALKKTINAILGGTDTAEALTNLKEGRL